MSIRALIILIAFVGLQLATINYGTKINDAPHLLKPVSTSTELAEQLARLAQPAVVNTGEKVGETQSTWWLRYRLYSIDADEMVNLMALSRMNPGQFKLDPHFYMYGGAYLYPLGFYYWTLQQVHILPAISLEILLQNHDIIDRLYIAGRIFVLAAFTASGFIFYKIVHHVVRERRGLADIALALYLFAPASIMFSNVIKPHWYALIFANGALLFVLKKKFTPWLGVLLGLAVGSATTYAPFVIAVGLFLMWQWHKKALPPKSVLLIGSLTVLTFIIANPYVFLDRLAAQQEAQALGTWYQWTANPLAVWQFIKNSLVPGLGLVALVALIIPGQRVLAASLWVIVVLIGLLAHQAANLHVNARLVPYLLPVMILYVAWYFQKKPTWLLPLLAFTLLQSMPLIIAYADENNPRHSTRLQAATWINQTIPTGSKVCAQLVPYNAPPFDFTKFAINSGLCEYIVEVERESDHIVVNPTHHLIQRFTPRFNNSVFPLVFNHINPQISIYQP